MFPGSCAMQRLQAGPHAGAWLTHVARLGPHADSTPPQATASCCRWQRPFVVIAVRVAAGSVRTHLVTTPWRALARACLPDEQRLSRGRGAESPVKPLVRKGMWCPSNGSHTPPGIASDDRRRLYLVKGATPLGGAICCDATLVSPLRRDGTPHAYPHMLGPLLGMGPCCKWQCVANEPPTPSSPKGALRCSDVKLADVGTPQQCRLCGAWSRCAPARPHRPCAAPPEQPGRDDGGVCSPRPCKGPWATRH